MARPQKEGLDYFPLDVEMDDKVKLIDAKFGVTGFGILVKVWQIIYDNGYYIKWTEKELLLYKNRINADINLINDVINECLKWGIFNQDMYDKYLILTSSGVQKRFFEATNRRQEVSLTSAYILASLPEKYKPKIKELPIVNVNNNSKNADIGTQSKVKKSKVKESKDICGVNPTDTPTKSSKFIPPTLEEVKAYCTERHNSVDAEKWHDFYQSKNWMIGKNKMKDWKAAVRTWEKEKQNQGSNQQSKAPNKGNFEQRKYDDGYFDKLYKDF